MAFSLIRRLLLFVAAAMIPIAMSQTKAAPPSDSCNGIFLSYAHTGREKIPPILKSGGSTDDQPYRFESTLTVLNNGREEVKSWRAFVGFQLDEYLVSASGAVLADGTSLPTSVGGGVVFAGYPSTDLKTAIETAGDVTQMQVQVKFVGTQFGVASPSVPMPTNISLVNDGFVCPKPDIMQGKSEMQVCCRKDPKFKSHTTSDDEFLPRQNGDLTIMFDVTRTYESNYWAKVTISNHNPLGRLDNWKLSWDWMKGEFINSMKGAYPDIVDTTDCIFGEQGQYYQGLDFSNVLNCERRPTIIDLPPTKANDSMLGKIPFCCRNGTILPPSMDPSRSTSAFEMNVYKMPPNLNRSELSPPQNWNITGALNPDYRCGPPVRVSPSEFVDTSGLPSNITVVASWQVVCNITQPPKGASPKCCVSFSAYYDESVVPCRTCACGCPSTQSRTCSTTAPAVLLPPEALLVPFENRSARTKAWAALKHLTLPNPMPCGDNCGVSINWHLFTDNSRGWTARMTIFNWGETSYADWFAAVQMDNAAPGFQGMYSLKAIVLDGVNNTIFMQGPEGFNYLVAETDGDNPQKDVRVPGKQQSVISFTKKHTPGINVPEGAGFPSKVFFNGEECSLPLVLPTSSSFRKNSVMTIPVLLLLIVVLLMSMQQ